MAWRGVAQVVARFCKLFEEPLFHIHAGALSFALLATTSVVSGHRDLYVLGLWPIAFAYITVLGLEGDIIQESSEQMLGAAFTGRWQVHEHTTLDPCLLCLCPVAVCPSRRRTMADVSLAQSNIRAALSLSQTATEVNATGLPQECDLAFAKDILLVMGQASRPAAIRARWLGALSLPTLHRLLSSWYSFTQLFMRLQ